MERGQFSSRLAFILAASGSAVGLGNIWGFPTNAAENGGAAFVLMYMILAFLLAYPAMMAELIIGRHTQSNMVNALQSVSNTSAAKRAGWAVGMGGMVTASLILCFYSLVAGWMLAFMLEPLTALIGLPQLGNWLTEFSLARNVGFAALFIGLTALVISAGVEQGIEKWSQRLMPSLLRTSYRPYSLRSDATWRHAGFGALSGAGLFSDERPEANCQRYGSGVLFHESGGWHYADLRFLYSQR